MAQISRRQLFKLAGAGVAGAAVLPGVARASRGARASTSSAFDGTTLSRTIGKGASTNGKYYTLVEKAGEPHLLRSELAQRTTTPARASLLNFVHFTDIHLIDASSPARVEFLDRYNDGPCKDAPFASAYRAHETMTVHVLEAMVRQIRAIGVSPVTGAPLQFVMSTGDNVDNEQLNELRWFIDVMDGGKTIVPGNSTGTPYDGVMAAGPAGAFDEEYWHPDAGIADKYKRHYGFPDYPGLLEDSVRPFVATGLGLPWMQTFGNHDGLMQGNAPRNPFFEVTATGHVKVVGPPAGLDPCDSFEIMQRNPAALMSGAAKLVVADPTRRIVKRSEYIEQHFNTTGTPNGHGFTQQNRIDGTAYYIDDSWPGFRLITLDTVNPGGYNDGSIGQAQLDWLVARLTEVSSHVDNAATGNTDKLVIIFSHHGLRSLGNQVIAPNADEPGSNDLPRKLADEVEAAVQRFPNVIAWVNGHTHNNIIAPRPGANGGFWDIGTAAHVDFPPQSRLIEVLDNGDGTLSLLCTIVDHAGPVTPGGTDDVLRLASISRELSANDYHVTKGPGQIQDRNTELVIRAPFALPPTTSPVQQSMLILPKSPGLVLATLAAAGVGAVINRRMRAAADQR